MDRKKIFLSLLVIGVIIYTVLQYQVIEKKEETFTIRQDSKDSNKIQGSKEPASKEPASKVPASKVPDSKVPASKEPASKEPASKVPASKVPDSKVPASKEPTSNEPDSKEPKRKKSEDIPQNCAPTIKNSTSNLSSSNMTCQLPVLDPFHPSIMKYISTTTYPECPGKPYGKLINGRLEFTDKDVASATYRAITRNGDFAVKFSKSAPVVQNQIITDEFLEVDFLLKNGDTAKEFFLQVVPRKSLLNRKPVKPPGIPLNILIIGVDSLSHASAKRKLPKIYKFLQDLDAYIFQGHAVVGDGTTEQLTPMLTGRKFSEQYEGRAGFKGARTLDEWTWIYKQLKELGYITGHSEDSIEYGPFHYRLKGYTNPPTDLYSRPFFERAKKFNSGRPNLCLNSKNIALYQFDYVRSVFETLPRDQLKFFFSFNGGHGHHGINIVQKIEWDFLDLLQEFKSKGYLNNTLLIVMGDHGLRFGQVRESVQGKLEERLPLFSMAFPPWFKTRYPKLAAILKTNTKRLTSWFDVYATFRHMLSYPNLPTDLTHGQSLFTDVSKLRTCVEASIPDHWCPCLEWAEVNVEHIHIENAVQETVEYINKLNQEKNKTRTLCRKLSLKEVNYAMLERPNERVLKFSHVGWDWKTKFSADFKNSNAHLCRYQVQFVTAPNNGVYEATIGFDRGKFKVNPGISRVNAYGRQPECIANEFPHLRKFCYCTNYVDTTS